MKKRRGATEEEWRREVGEVAVAEEEEDGVVEERVSDRREVVGSKALWR